MGLLKNFFNDVKSHDFLKNIFIECKISCSWEANLKNSFSFLKQVYKAFLKQNHFDVGAMEFTILASKLVCKVVNP